MSDALATLRYGHFGQFVFRNNFALRVGWDEQRKSRSFATLPGQRNRSAEEEATATAAAARGRLFGSRAARVWRNVARQSKALSAAPIVMIPALDVESILRTWTPDIPLKGTQARGVVSPVSPVSEVGVCRFCRPGEARSHLYTRAVRSRDARMPPLLLVYFALSSSFRVRALSLVLSLSPFLLSLFLSLFHSLFLSSLFLHYVFRRSRAVPRHYVRPFTHTLFPFAYGECRLTG